MFNKKCDTDGLMKKIYVHLVSDFRSKFGDKYASEPLGSFLVGGIKALRGYKFPGRAKVNPSLFKVEYQLESFFKRYRFKDDLFTDEQLEYKAVEKFMATQTRLAAGLRMTPLLQQVVQKARGIAKEILGEYSDDEHEALCRFGKRACVGTSLVDSNLCTKLARPLTGSLEHIRWFKRYLTTDEHLRDAIREASGKRRPSYKMCDTLTMSHVPKSYKALRGILPDTLLGSFYTNGLGRYIQEKLRVYGLDIRRLQSQHGRLAKEASVNRKLVTADLSAASDSLTSHLLRMVLPLPWFRAVTYGRIPHINIGGTRIRMETVLTMGLGHTFPLQTLVFYSLLKAIDELAGNSGKVSVYGDDLIYSRRIHPLVSRIFPRLNLILNEDKTYAEDYFRESCGSDYFRGSDVRPFSPEGSYQQLDRFCYAEFLYKLYNGLRRRWEEGEIPKTLEFLKCELILHTDEILTVPADYPETSGIQSISHSGEYFCTTLETNHYLFSTNFPYLRRRNKNKKAFSQACYYWEWLRKASTVEDDHDFSITSDTPLLKWTRKSVREKGVKKHVLVAMVVDKRTSEISKALGNTTSFGLPPEFEKLVSSSLTKQVILDRVARGPRCLRRSWRGARVS